MGMAKRNYSKRSKIEPAAMTFAVSFPLNGNTSGTKYADLSQIASIINRRFYRQGLNWAVSGFKILNVNGVQGAVSIAKLPNTWVMSNAWEKGMRTWQKMNSEALAETESIRPKFLDFKIYADAGHHTAGFALNLLPLSGAGVVGAPGEWEPSKYVWTDPSAATAAAGLREMEVLATGPNFPGGGASALNAVSLIEGYAASRGLPDIQDPNAPDDAADAAGPSPANWMAAIFNQGTEQDEEILESMITENNVAPYPFENGPIVGGGTYTDTQYPGGANQLTGLEFHDVEYFTATTISNTVRLKGGNFPCGLVRIDAANQSPEVGQFTILIDMVPGNHRGYLAESMTEM